MVTTQEFLRYFGSPLVLLLPEVEGVNSFPGRPRHNNGEVLLKINYDNPYGMFFTPNGNYGSLQKEGQKIKRAKLHPGPAPLYNSLVVDVDVNKSKTYQNKESLRKHIDEVILAYGVSPTFIVESGGGFHIYRIIKEADRQSIHELFGEKIFAVSRYMASLFDGGDPNCKVTSGDINGLIRVPGTFHRKTGKPVGVKVVYAEPKDQLTIGMIEHALKAITESTKAVTSNQDLTITVGAEGTMAVNELPFDIVIGKLSTYPRLCNGQRQTFRLDGTTVCIVDEHGGVTRTDGYKYCKEKNYINCFTKDYHPIDERPRGAVFPFLYHYFNKNINLVKSFLSAEFGLTFEATVKGGEEKILQTFTGDDYFVEMTNKRVILHKTVMRGTKAVDLHEDIFRKSFEIIGKSWVKFHPNGTETDEEQMVYVMRINDAMRILYRFPTKKRFNEKYSGYLRFYGEDNDLGLFYEAIDKTDVPTVQVTVLNGYYEDCVVLGGKIVYGTNTNRFITPTFEFETKRSEEIPLLRFYSKFCEIYEEEIALPIFLQSIAMAGMNIREGTTVYPSLLITGRTGSGKSSIAEIMKNMLGYGFNDRRIALPQITPQPLKVKATDNSILFCDELTANVNERVEETVRNIINRDKGGRGIGAENAHYNFRSPLMFTGERTFKDESLNNRMVAVVISEKHRKPGGFEKIQDIKEFSCINAIYDGYHNYTGDINQLQKERAYKIVESGVSPRNADVRSYIFVINEVFKFRFNEDELLDMANRHLKCMGFGSDDAYTDEGELQMYLSRMIFTRQVQCMQEVYKNKRIFRFIFMDETIYQKARGTFTSLINSLNSHGERIKISKNGLTMEIRELNADKIDFVLDKIGNFVLSCNNKLIQYVDRENEEGPSMER